MFTKQHIHVIILAAGSGVRMKKRGLKQFFLLKDFPVVMHSLIKFSQIIPDVKLNLVLPVDKIKYWKALCSKYKFRIPHIIFNGGKTRFFSVKNALSSMSYQDEDLIIIHDSVRPFFTGKLLKKLIYSALKNGHAVPVLAIKDSLRKKFENNNTISVDRSKFLLTQTPQVFKADIIQSAYFHQANTINKTDDVSLIEEMVNPINLIYGEELNFKITNQEDWELAKMIAGTIL